MVNHLKNPSEWKEYRNNVICFSCKKKYEKGHKCNIWCEQKKEIQKNTDAIINNNWLNNHTISIDFQGTIYLIWIKSIIKIFFDKDENNEYIYISYIVDLLVFLDSFLEDISNKNNINLKDEEYLLIIWIYEDQFNKKNLKEILSILPKSIEELEKDLEGNIEQDLLQYYIFKLLSLTN